MRRLFIIVGLTLACTLAAQQPALKSGIEPGNIDAAVRPQDDFYLHINGGWIAKTEMPADKARYGAFEELADRAEADVRTLIEGAAGSADRPAGSVAQQIGDLYASFMNEARADQLSAGPVQ